MENGFFVGGQTWGDLSLLREYSTYTVCRCVSLEVELLIEVGLEKDRGLAHYGLNFIKCLLVTRFPFEYTTLLCEVEQRADDH